MEQPAPDSQSAGYASDRERTAAQSRIRRGAAESVGRLIRKLGKPEQLRVCCEAGPTVLAVERIGRQVRSDRPDFGAGRGA
jgi:hypothetical protein